MTTLIKLISEVNQLVTDLLIKGVGVVDTIRFLNQFRPGQGDYTKDRKNFLKGWRLRISLLESRKWRNEMIDII